jgi:hypothetical protein
MERVLSVQVLVGSNICPICKVKLAVKECELALYKGTKWRLKDYTRTNLLHCDSCKLFYADSKHIRRFSSRLRPKTAPHKEYMALLKEGKISDITEEKSSIGFTDVDSLYNESSTDVCQWKGCTSAVYRNNLCRHHYNQELSNI